ncbi:lysophospholipid acyltransferase family protein [Paenibacillus hunanensis]|uniref:lysophospholipid acyltransferase family protein n=1 Tax=Paenibacillus hunanensis TaxID=539262 RepID=UPI002026E4ED|nr:lysophospholipid acyltransferase family protein [Paenibacillus hunanensis]MCL9661804.1 lysophospholipid acyltransferase family protein [Paenibacillus hunanensis]
MIAANKSAAFEQVFRLYNEWYLLRRQFHSFMISGELDMVPAGQPAVYMMNHSSWWDGLLVYHALKRTSSAEHYMMMEQRQLERYRFFGKIGAFSINKDSPSDIRQSMRYAGQLLEQGQRVWIFPQGEIRHLETRPLDFRAGISLLLRQSNLHIPVIPVTLYYGLFQHARLQASLMVGQPLLEDWRALSAAACGELLEQRLTTQLDQHRAEMIAAQGEWLQGRDLIPHRRSTDDKYDQYRKWRKR